MRQAQRRAATDRLAANLELTKTAFNFLGFKHPTFGQRNNFKFQIVYSDRIRCFSKSLDIINLRTNVNNEQLHLVPSFIIIDRQCQAHQGIQTLRNFSLVLVKPKRVTKKITTNYYTESEQSQHGKLAYKIESYRFKHTYWLQH